MLPGPNYIYKCPKCNTLHQQMSLMSGNTFGAMIYSDGNMFAPMMPDIPKITLCTECRQIFWLDEQNLVGTYDFNDPINEAFEQAASVSHLYLEDLIYVIENSLYRNEDEEFYIRQRLWWVFNQKLLKDSELLGNQHMKSLYQNNCVRLIELFKGEYDNERVFIAELYRNLGQFDRCMDILKSLQDEEYKERKQALLKKCKEKDNKVFLVK
ncbi:MAG: hypothetical protein PHT69_03130 [Bacteroidales bacterium]|nr:hypothetical protein [Bacteroidales bacterium]